MEDARVRQHRPDVLHVLQLLIVGRVDIDPDAALGSLGGGDRKRPVRVGELRQVSTEYDVQRVAIDAGSRVVHGDPDRLPRGDRLRQQLDRRPHRVVDPEAEREWPGPRARRRVEDEVVDAGRREDRADHGRGVAEVAVRVQRRGQPRVAVELVLVVVANEARRDVGVTTEDGDAEVRNRLAQPEPEDHLRSSEAGRDTVRDAELREEVTRNARRAAGRVAAVCPRSNERLVRIELELRDLDVEPERHTADVAAAREHDEARAVARARVLRHREPELDGLAGDEARRDRLELRARGQLLWRDRHRPRIRAAAGVRGYEILASREAPPYESPAERRRSREEERRVRDGDVDAAAALAQRRCLVPAGVRGNRRRDERRLDLLHRPRGMALEEERSRARDLRGRHARAVPACPAVGRERTKRPRRPARSRRAWAGAKSAKGRPRRSPP